jgi:hypothetical protein
MTTKSSDSAIGEFWGCNECKMHAVHLLSIPMGTESVSNRLACFSPLVASIPIIGVAFKEDCKASRQGLGVSLAWAVIRLPPPECRALLAWIGSLSLTVTTRKNPVGYREVTAQRIRRSLGMTVILHHRPRCVEEHYSLGMWCVEKEPILGFLKFPRSLVGITVVRTVTTSISRIMVLFWMGCFTTSIHARRTLCHAITFGWLVKTAHLVILVPPVFSTFFCFRFVLVCIRRCLGLPIWTSWASSGLVTLIGGTFSLP